MVTEAGDFFFIPPAAPHQPINLSELGGLGIELICGLSDELAYDRRRNRNSEPISRATPLT